MMVGVHEVRVEWTKVTIDGASSSLGTATDLTGIMQVQVNTKLGKSADSFTVKVSDISNGVENYWRNRITSGDLLKIYSSTDGVTETLEMDAIVKQVTKTLSPDNKELVITGLNRLEALLGLITPVVSFAGQTKSADYWIRLLIREANTQNGYASYSGNNSDGEPTTVTIKRPDRYIYAGLPSEWLAAGNDVITDTDLYTTTSFYKGDQITFETIEELSSETYSGIQHIFYLDGNNQFIWIPLATTVSGSFPNKYVDAKIDKSEYDMVNYVIVSAGNNLYGNATIKNFKYDLVSATENGIRAKTLYLNGVRDIVLRELRLKLKADAKFAESTFPFATSYPITPPAQWLVQDSITTDGELNAAFVDEVIARTNNYADSYLLLRTAPTVRAKRQIPDETNQQTNYVLGGYYTDTFTSKDLRVIGRVKTYTPKEGWETDLTLEEDYDKI